MLRTHLPYYWKVILMLSEVEDEQQLLSRRCQPRLKGSGKPVFRNITACVGALVPLKS